jgi:hypothetical protein
LDSQSIRAADTVSKASRGFDGGKKVDGCVREVGTHHPSVGKVELDLSTPRRTPVTQKPNLWCEESTVVRMLCR